MLCVVFQQSFSLTFSFVYKSYFNSFLIAVLFRIRKKTCLRFISYKSHENRHINFSNSHATSSWSLDGRVMFGSLWHYVSTFPIHLLQVEICILFVTWPNKTTPLRCHAYLWVRAHCRMSPPWKVWWPQASW